MGPQERVRVPRDGSPGGAARYPGVMPLDWQQEQ